MGRTVQISVGNGRHYGTGMTVESTAEPDDGRLDAYSLEVPHWWQLLRLVPSLRRGTHGTWRDVRAFSATELTVTTSRPRPVNADGELITTTPARFRVLPGAIRIYAPRTPSEDQVVDRESGCLRNAEFGQIVHDFAPLSADALQ
jgi:diacylglycerol kinase (ATP)